ncbi:MAG: hypothetical protein UIH99_04310 [Alphaproteobacteria bacterium]|nr:hypothetical protein [Alphaproteobacteria bacterium]
MTDMVKKFGLGTATLQQQGSKVRGFNKGMEALNVAAMLARHGITFGGNDSK